MAVERRAAAELRAAGNRLSGYAAVFGKASEDLGGFVEIVRPGAFRRALASSVDVPALYDHDTRAILGRTRSGTLRLEEDAKGLRFELEVANTGAGRDVLELVGRGDVSGASFAFTATEQRWHRDGDRLTRELLDVELLDVTITPTPAYPDTEVARRAMMAAHGRPVALALAGLRLKLMELSA